MSKMTPEEGLKIVEQCLSDNHLKLKITPPKLTLLEGKGLLIEEPTILVVPDELREQIKGN